MSTPSLVFHLCQCHGHGRLAGAPLPLPLPLQPSPCRQLPPSWHATHCQRHCTHRPTTAAARNAPKSVPYDAADTYLHMLPPPLHARTAWPLPKHACERAAVARLHPRISPIVVTAAAAPTRATWPSPLDHTRLRKKMTVSQNIAQKISQSFFMFQPVRNLVTATAVQSA